MVDIILESYNMCNLFWYTYRYLLNKNLINFNLAIKNNNNKRKIDFIFNIYVSKFNFELWY